MNNNISFNPNSIKYRMNPNDCIINYEFVRDFCGSMRGYEAMFTKEDQAFADLANTCSRELMLHWLPIAVRKVVRDYHISPYGVKSIDAIEEVEKYLVILFKNVATRYNLKDTNQWKNQEIIDAVYDEIFWGHKITYDRCSNDDNIGRDLYAWTTHVVAAMSIRLHYSIDAILASDKYKLINHAYMLQRNNKSLDNEIGAIIIKNSSDVSDFNPIPEGYKDAWDQSYTAGTDYENLIHWNDAVELVFKW